MFCHKEVRDIVSVDAHHSKKLVAYLLPGRCDRLRKLRATVPTHLEAQRQLVDPLAGMPLEVLPLCHHPDAGVLARLTEGIHEDPENEAAASDRHLIAGSVVLDLAIDLDAHRDFTNGISGCSA